LIKIKVKKDLVDFVSREDFYDDEYWKSSTFGFVYVMLTLLHVT